MVTQSTLLIRSYLFLKLELECYNDQGCTFKVPHTVSYYDMLITMKTTEGGKIFSWRSWLHTSTCPVASPCLSAVDLFVVKKRSSI